jgi:hypothetical protein
MLIQFVSLTIQTVRQSLMYIVYSDYKNLFLLLITQKLKLFQKKAFPIIYLFLLLITQKLKLFQKKAFPIILIKLFR